jgi:VWFA-related protein
MFTYRHTRSALLALLVLTYVLGTAAADDTNGSPDLPTYRSTVSEVRITFFATDENNHPLANLTQSDFAVVDSERVVRNFRSLAHSEETALDVVALVDVSESVAPRLRAVIRDVRQLVELEQSIPDDNLSVLFFGGTSGGAVGETSGGLRPPAVLCTSGCRAPDSLSGLTAVKSGGVTPLFDALLFAADFVAQHRRDDRRNDVSHVLILFSDGHDTVSLHSAREALQAVVGAGAVIYCVDTGKSEDQLPNQASGSMFLRRVSEATGGRYFSLSPHLSQQNGAAAVRNAVLEDLRASYVVTYDLPSREAGFHSLRLLPTHNLNLTFHSRNGYDYEPGVR